jgi:hypothetical protein
MREHPSQKKTCQNYDDDERENRKSSAGGFVVAASPARRFPSVQGVSRSASASRSAAGNAVTNSGRSETKSTVASLSRSGLLRA